jgi:hypothetical protein
MKLYLRPIHLLEFLLFFGYVVWGWVGWLRSSEKVSPQWRAIIAVAGLCFATVSTVLSIFLYVHAVVTGGYPLFHPIEIFCIRLGSLTAFIGLMSAIVGKGKIRIHVAVISILNLLLWFMDAMAQ